MCPFKLFCYFFFIKIAILSIYLGRITGFWLNRNSIVYNEGKHNYLYLLKQDIYSRNKPAGTDIPNRSFLYIHETTFQSYLQKNPQTAIF